MMKGVKRLCAALVGVVFFIAGLFKLMDPVGSGLVVEEYLKFLHLPFFIPLSLAIGLCLAFLETIVGAGLITNTFRRFVAPLCGLMLGGFTILTLVLVIANPNMDCGCFGEAVHLTHMQSFIKNIVLLALWGVAFFAPGGMAPSRVSKQAGFMLTCVAVFGFAAYSLIYLPLRDFTSFKAGSVLMQALDEPDPSAPLLSFTDSQGDYVDEMAVEGKVMLVSCYDPEKLSEASWDKMASFLSEASATGFRPLLLLSMVPEGLDPVTVGLPEPMVADRRTLMTLNRSNGGASYLYDGMIISKWSSFGRPDAEKLSSLAEVDSMQAFISQNTPQRLKLQGFLLFVFSVMLLL